MENLGSAIYLAVAAAHRQGVRDLEDRNRSQHMKVAI